MLRRLLTGDLSADDAPARRAFEASPEAEGRWRELERTTRELDAEARERERVLAEVAGAAPDAHEDELVESFAARLRAAAPARGADHEAPAVPRRGWIVAAAAIFVVALALRHLGREREVAEPFELGPGSSECRPSGEVERYGRFEWDLELPPGGTYELSVWEASADDGAPLVRVELGEPFWDAVELPRRIHWQVSVLDAAGELTEASCSSRCWLASH
jgi:hypothetical protein